MSIKSELLNEQPRLLQKNRTQSQITLWQRFINWTRRKLSYKAFRVEVLNSMHSL